jgi:uncharacterized membrane protein HdeD (DUF308 family)
MSGVAHDSTRDAGPVWFRPGLGFSAEQMRSHWKLLLAIGALLELMGLFSILVPIVASISVAILAGWALLVGGVVQFGHMLRREAGWERTWRLFLAAVTALAGLSLLLFPLTGTITITFVLVVWLFISGGTRIGAWWSIRHAEGTWPLGANGLASVVLGALIWASLPSSAAWAIGLLVGIELVLYGMTLIVAGAAGRRAEQHVA